jgi:hypothetical protein
MDFHQVYQFFQRFGIVIIIVIGFSLGLLSIYLQLQDQPLEKVTIRVGLVSTSCTLLGVSIIYLLLFYYRHELE